MRFPIICTILLTIALGGCGVSDTATLPAGNQTAVIATQYAATGAAITPTFDQAALQEQVDAISNEATIVAATMGAVRSDPATDPAVATAAAERYQATFATAAALQPTLIAFGTPLAPRISDAAQTAAGAAYSADAQAAAQAAASAAPAAGQSVDEATALQQATIIAATMVALHTGGTVEPAVATEVTRRYQDNNATLAALYPTPTAQPLPPTVEAPATTPVPLPDIQQVPVVPAPAGLAGMTLPATQAETAALFGTMPSSVAGQDRSDASAIAPGRISVIYGTITLPGSNQLMPRLLLTGTDQQLELSTPGWTGAHVITALAQQSPDRIRAWGREDHLYWLHLAGPVDPSHTNPNQIMLIGSDTSTWVFQLITTSPDELDALAAALAGAMETAR